MKKGQFLFFRTRHTLTGTLQDIRILLLFKFNYEAQGSITKKQIYIYI